jgi:hypothetical protein
MRGATSPSEMVKGNAKPFIDAAVYGVILITNLFWCFSLFEGFHFGSSAVFVSAAYEHHIMAHQSAKPCINIC